jgi:NADH dehydrogenase [ubiquinone] 1 alpha subcomplex assembly factor 6
MLARRQLARKCLSSRFTPTPWRHTRSMATLLGSNPDTTGSADPSVYCKDLVRKYDYESFLTSQFYPKEMQGGYFALKAFYVSFLDIHILRAMLTCLISCMKVELAMIQDTVSNSMLGKMRMQFWRDAVKQMSDVCVAAFSSPIIERFLIMQAT